MPSALSNTAWLLSCLPGRQSFLEATRNVRRTQEAALQRILHLQADTEFGHRHHFSSLRTSDDFQRVPLSEYEDYLPSLDRIRQGQPNVLTSEPVKFLQPTSGSAGATKLIPYTTALGREIRAAIAPWIASLYLASPTLLAGRQYWSISPHTRPPSIPPSVVPIGFADDTEYLGALQRRMAEGLFAVPAGVSQADDSQVWTYLTLLFLLRERNLRLISVWHPSFLGILAGAAREWADPIANDIQSGTLRGLPGSLPESLSGLASTLKPDPHRAEELRYARSDPDSFFSKVWSRLTLISCWTDGNSAAWLPEIKRQFPSTIIQGKGLAATEGIVSIPLGLTGLRTLAIRSHFFEFLDEATGNLHRAWEVEKGRIYSIVLTTSGGLYRYRLHDRVRVTGFFNQAPCIEFLSRDNMVSDFVGEKLSLAHVESSLQQVGADRGIHFTFAMLAPLPPGPDFGYVLYFQTRDPAATDLPPLADRLEAALCSNFHYLHARRLSQLKAVRLFAIRGPAASIFREHLMNRGTRAGDVKFLALSRNTDWNAVFPGDWIS